ncbi:YceD family protein [Flavobacterium sp. ARAG 55.4]|uniref:YceD family protein n=1 Tax=Flavobacterium sp. ARAG 55.4 TaxID=3451357 RepID=UPI003F4809FF
MNRTKEFLIPFVGLKLGKHHFEYQINNAFFENFEYDEFQNSEVKVSVVLEKKSNMLELSFKHKGTVNVPCDLTGEDFDLPIKGKMKLIVRFGEEFNNDNEELLILPFGEFEIDIIQYIYEMIVLSVPIKRVHPGVKDGSLKTDALEKLNELQIKEADKKENKEEDIDPRWDKLKQLLTDK